MRKKNFLLLIFILFFVASYPQNVGINSDGSIPDGSAMLDVKSPKKGLLVPRVSLTGTGDVTTITFPAVSLLVYNTATTSGSSGIIPGYYYWNGASWLMLTTSWAVKNALNWTRNGNVINPNNTTDTVQIGAPNYITTGAGNILNVAGKQLIYSPNDQITLTDTTIYVGGVQQKGTIQLNGRLQNGAGGTISGIRWYMVDSTSDYPNPFYGEDHGYGTVVFSSHTLAGDNQFPLIYSGGNIGLGYNTNFDMRSFQSLITIGGNTKNTGTSPFEMRAWDGSVWWQKAYVSGNTSFGKNTDNGIGRVQVNGRLTVDTVVTGSNTDSLVVINNNEFKKIASKLFSGTATLTSGTVTVATTAVKTGARIYVSVNTPSGNQGFLSAATSSIVNGASFIINSTSATENSTVNWEIINL